MNTQQIIALALLLAVAVGLGMIQFGLIGKKREPAPLPAPAAPVFPPDSAPPEK
jgi:hypothetical protein